MGTVDNHFVDFCLLIIWNETHMTNKFYFEALDKTLRDILRTMYTNYTTKPFT